MRFSPGFLTAALLAAHSGTAHADIKIDEIGGSVVSLQGLFQGDANYFNNDVVDLNGADSNDGKDQEFELRRAEVILIGKGANVDWQLGYDAKANKYLDSFVRYRMGTSFLQLGQYKQFNSLEELTSTRHNDFISKAMSTNLFGVGRRLGAAYRREEASWGYAFGWFGRELTRNLANGAGWGARGYFAPINEGGRFLHLGVSALDYDTDADTLRLRVRPNADLATARLVDTGNLLNADRQRTVGVEAAYVDGPFKLQSEFLHSQVSRYDTPSAAQPGDTFSGNSWYLYGLWNITGESWTYKGGVPATGLPGNLQTGMWQLGLRYDSTHLNDHPVLGGEEQNLTLGVNWYWRANFKFMLNYVKVSSERFSSSLRTDVSDDPSILEARAQIYW